MRNFFLGLFYILIFTVNFIIVAYGMISIIDGEASRLQWSSIEARRGADLIQIFWCMFFAHIIGLITFFKLPRTNRVYSSALISTIGAVPICALYGAYSLSKVEDSLIGNLVASIFVTFFMGMIAAPFLILPIIQNFIFFRYLDRREMKH